MNPRDRLLAVVAVVLVAAFVVAYAASSGAARAECEAVGGTWAQTGTIIQAVPTGKNGAPVLVPTPIYGCLR